MDERSIGYFLGIFLFLLLLVYRYLRSDLLDDNRAETLDVSGWVRGIGSEDKLAPGRPIISRGI